MTEIQEMVLSLQMKKKRLDDRMGVIKATIRPLNEEYGVLRAEALPLADAINALEQVSIEVE